MTEKNLTYQQRCFIWASGHYLSDSLEPDFFDLETQNQFEFLQENAWHPFENYQGKDIYDYIYDLACDIENKLYPMENN